MDPATLFLRKFLDRVTGEISSRTGHLIDGKSVKDFADYRERVGYLRALHDVVEWARDAHKELLRSDDEQPNPNRAVPQRDGSKVRKFNVEY